MLTYTTKPPHEPMRLPFPWEQQTLERIWSASQDADEPLSRPRDGWWSITAWATDTAVVLDAGQIVGVAAIEFRHPAEVAEARVALLPAHRRWRYAELLVRKVVDLARGAGASQVRLFSPSGAVWSTAPAQAIGFVSVRTQHTMLRPVKAGPLLPSHVPGIAIRSLGDGEEHKLLQALNRAWADTWNFRPLTLAALRRDLTGQQGSMFVAIADHDQIVGTSHAMFDPANTNPAGGPYAWISNLTTDPSWRGRGLGRALLTHAVNYLRTAGAESVALGVDGSAAIPLGLYQSAGFTTISTVTIWEKAVSL